VAEWGRKGKEGGERNENDKERGKKEERDDTTQRKQQRNIPPNYTATMMPHPNQ